ncbi:MAG: DNA replication/repair protein RecF [Gammaproteobacteria bacterium]|nr:DNA replication/repair protein RecF [Gammaproteobacteria bacterium]
MIVERIDIGNVRNIDLERLELDPRANLLVGPNGAGKTSALEAVHLVMRGRSFRTTRPDRVIRHGEEQMSIAALLADESVGRVRLGYAREKRGRVELRRDGQVIRQSSRVASLLPIQLLLPDLPELVFGSPGGRRQWLDWGVFHVKQDYAAVLGGYLRALRHRNTLLRAADLKTLPAWTEQVAELGEAVAQARRDYFDRVIEHVAASLTRLDPDLDVEWGYSQGWNADSLAEVLGQQVDRDVKLGTTLAGPHRADVRITSGSESAAQVLSRGQGKAVASALRMGQAKDLAVAGSRSLFLIDDLGAELDEAHNERYFRQLEDMDCQIIATSTEGAIGEILMGSRRGRMFHVKQGHFEHA